MSLIGDLGTLFNIWRTVSRDQYTYDSSFDVHITPPGDAEYDLENIRFVVAIERNTDHYEEQIDSPEVTRAVVVRNVEKGDERLKGQAYLYTITNRNRISFSIHNMQSSDLAVLVDVSKEKWFHNEEREVQFLVTSHLTLTRLEIDYDSITEVYRPDQGRRRMICTEKKVAKVRKADLRK